MHSSADLGACGLAVSSTLPSGNESSDRASAEAGKRPSHAEGLRSIILGNIDFYDRAAYFRARFSDKAVIERLVNNTRSTTDAAYKTAWKRYVRFCDSRGNMLENVDSFLSFTVYLDLMGLMASTTCSCAMAISAIIMTAEGASLVQDAYVDRILESLKRHGRRASRENSMWGLGEALRKLGEREESGISFLARKPAFLIASAMFWRPASDLAWISYKSIRFTKDSVMLTAHDVKASRSKSTRIVTFSNHKICPAQTLREYLDRTRNEPAKDGSDSIYFSEWPARRDRTNSVQMDSYTYDGAGYRYEQPYSAFHKSDSDVDSA